MIFAFHIILKLQQMFLSVIKFWHLMQVNLIHILIKKLHLIKILQNNFHKKEIKSDGHFTFWMARGIQVYIYTFVYANKKKIMSQVKN
jgi:hypothetical protein